MNLLLKNLRCYLPESTVGGDLRIRFDRIVNTKIGLSPGPGERAVDCSGYCAFPGLINSHDHLECNLFPRLGQPPYTNVHEWAQDIYAPKKSPVRDILRTSLTDRLLFGGYKNLFSGVTTVIHHDRYYRNPFSVQFPVKVLDSYGWSHSIGFGKNIPKDYAKSNGRPFIIHAAEGTDSESRAELDTLGDLGVLGENTVLVHGIAISEKQALLLSERQVSLIWCPSSNNYLFGRTAPVDVLNGRIRLALGTDSTMSGTPFLLDELKIARSMNKVPDPKLLKMVLHEAAELFKLADGRGTHFPGAPADLILLPDNGKSAPDLLIEARPQDLCLVLINGQPKLADQNFARRLELGVPNLRIGGKAKWVHGPIQPLIQRIAGQVDKKWLDRSPVWNEIEVIG